MTVVVELFRAFILDRIAAASLPCLFHECSSTTSWSLTLGIQCRLLALLGGRGSVLCCSKGLGASAVGSALLSGLRGFAGLALQALTGKEALCGALLGQSDPIYFPSLRIPKVLSGL